MSDFSLNEKKKKEKKIDSTTLCTLFRESRKISDVEDDMRGGNVWVAKYEVITCKRGMDAWKVKIRGIRKAREY